MSVDESVIEGIKKLDASIAKELLVNFCSIYLEKGFGTMNKTDIETLLYHVLMEKGILRGKCFDDSFALKIPETKARKLIYESQIKYANRDSSSLNRYLRTSVGNLLRDSSIIRANNKIQIAIEDKYLRVALCAKLRQNNLITDTSFNREIISLDTDSFSRMILLLVPNDQIGTVLDQINAQESWKDKNEDELKKVLSSEIVKFIGDKAMERIIKLGACLLKL